MALNVSLREGGLSTFVNDSGFLFFLCVCAVCWISFLSLSVCGLRNVIITLHVSWETMDRRMTRDFTFFPNCISVITGRNTIYS